MTALRFLLVAIAALVAGTTQAPAQEWPSKPIRFIVPFAAGGSTDVLTRLLCEQLTVELKTPCVVENKGGAGGNLGGAAVAASPPDGYTFLVSAPGVLAYNKILYREMAFDPDKDLDPICLYAFQPNVLVVHPSLPAKSVAELIAYAKAHPRTLNYASGGVGSTSQCRRRAVQDHGRARVAARALSRHRPVAGRPAGGPGPAHHRQPAGDPAAYQKRCVTRARHQYRPARAAAARPADHRRGRPAGLCRDLLAMVAAPSGTPRPILDRMAATISKLTADPAFRARVADAGAEPAGGTVDEARAFLKQETVKWREVVLKSGAKAD